MFDKEKYGRILVPMVTPFKEDQSVDYESAGAIARTLIERKLADSIIVTGTTGEFFTMSEQERKSMFETVLKEVGGRVPAIAGVGAASTVETVRLAKYAEKLGYDLVMVVAPYYTRPTDAELIQHFSAVADSVSVNVLLYNIPIFTGVNLSAQVLAELSKKQNICGIKEEAELRPKQVTEFLNATSEDFIIYCGDDTMILESYSQGGPNRIGGVVSGASHVIGDRIRSMIDTFLAGDISAASRIQRANFKFYRALGQNGRTNPVSLLKEAMKMVGYRAGVPRLPLTPATESERQTLKAVMGQLGLLKG